MAQALPAELNLYLRLGLDPIPPNPLSKRPYVKWGNGWSPTPDSLVHWIAKPKTNWGVRCRQTFAVLDFGIEETFLSFTAINDLLPGCPVKTGRSYHISIKRKKPIPSQHVGNLELAGDSR